jgi:hypothetical protein
LNALAGTLRRAQQPDKEVIMLSRFKTRDFDVLEIIPPSSSILKEKLDDILGDSEKWNAVIESVDPATGMYRILLQGRLRPVLSEDRTN